MTRLLTPHLRVEVLETRSLLNGNSLLGLMQPRLSPPPGHEPGLYAWHMPSMLTNTAVIRVVSPDGQHDDQLDVYTTSPTGTSPAENILQNDKVNNPQTETDGNSFVNSPSTAPANAAKPLVISNNSSTEKETPLGDRPDTPHRPHLSRPDFKPAVNDPSSPPSVDQNDPTRPPPNNDAPSRPGLDSNNPNPPADGGDRPGFDARPDQPPVPPPQSNRPFRAFYWTWAQAEAARQLASANSGAAGATTSSTDRGGAVSESAADDFFAIADKNLVKADADAAGNSDDLLAWNDELSEMPLIPGSFTPQQSELLGAVLALDVDALGQGVMRFFDRLDQLGNELLSAPDDMGLYPWFVALFATAASVEFIRRRRKPKLAAEFAATSAESSWS